MEFDLIDNFKLVIERIGKNKYKAVLLDPARRNIPIRTLGKAFWVGWARSKFLDELAEEVGSDPQQLKEVLKRIGSEIELKGKKILSPPAHPKKAEAAKELAGPDQEAVQRAELEYEQTVKEIIGRDVYDDLISIFEKTVREDRRSVEFVFLHLLSAYSSDPSNLGLDAPTSEGKTYPTVEVAKHFPREDVWFLGGLSPTALVHDHGELVDRNNNPIGDKLDALQNKISGLKKLEGEGASELEAAKNEMVELLKGSKYLVELENKILIFLETPQLETWEHIRPILSHDVAEISYKFTDKTSAGRLRTNTVVIKGWPASVYLKAGKGREDAIWPQIQSRFTTISPKMSPEKYRAAVLFAAMRKGLPSVVFDHKIGAGDFERAERIIRAIRRRLLDIKRMAREASKCNDPNLFWIPFYEEIGKEFPANVGRHMRDSKRFLTAMQMSAAANVFARPILEIGGTENIVVVRKDYERAVQLYFEEGGEEIFTGIPNHVIDFFKRVIIPLWRRGEPKHEQVGGGEAENVAPREGITVAAIVQKHKEVYEKGKSDKTIRNHYLPHLEDYGLISSEPDPTDKRRNRWLVLDEEVKPKNTLINALFGKGRIFTPETLKARLGELNLIRPDEPPVVYDCVKKSLSADQLLERYYLSTDSSGRIQIPPNPPPNPKNSEKNMPEIETSLNEPIIFNEVEPTPQDIGRAVCEYRKTKLAKVKLAELIGVSLDRLKLVLEELEKKGAVRDMGAMVEVY